MMEALPGHCQSAGSTRGLTEPGRQPTPYCLTLPPYEERAQRYDEILRQAAEGDDEALGLLFELAIPLIRRRCPPTLREHIDDIQQMVTLRLIQKFRYSPRPYQASTFIAFRSFLNQLTRNVSIDLWERERRTASLDALREATGYEPSGVDEVTLIEDRLRLCRCKDLLPDPLTREVFRLRFVLDLSVAEVVQALQAKGNQITRRDVYLMAERAILQLRSLPEVHEMFG